MTLANLPGYDEAARAADAYLTPRAKYMRDLERYVEGTQYEGLPDWFSDTKPLWERAPCIVDPIVRRAIESNADLCLGEGRFPRLSVEDVAGDDADDVEYVLARIAKGARLQVAAREAFEAAQGTGSACAIFGVRAGRLFIDTVKARWCEVELDADGAVLRLEIKYPYLTVVRIGGQQTVKAMLFRRVIDDKRDVTFLPGEARVEGIEPDWREDPKKSFAHGLGFCPVVWYPHMRGCAVVGDIDGKALHEHLTDEIRAHDFALSQRHRAALYAGDPQWTEVGVEPGYNPTDPVRRPAIPATLHGGRPGEAGPTTGHYVERPRSSKARKKSPGAVWQYPSDVEVKLHTLPGDALEAVSKHARDLRIKLSESLGVVFLDPENIPSATTLSGRALEMLFGRQLNRCDGYRADFGDRFLIPAMGMLIRIAIAKRLRIPKLDVVEKVIAGLGERWSWHSPPVSLTWGRYFRLTAEEEAKVIELVVKARDGGIATTRAAVEKASDVLGVKDIDAYIAELQKERLDGIADQQRIAKQLMMREPSPDPGDEDDTDETSSDADDDEETDARARARTSGRRGSRAA